jgi:hypothetical protein
LGRLLLAIVVAVLAISASGAASLVVAEPCAGDERPGNGDEGACPPTCATCGCCAQPAEPAVAVVVDSPRLPVALPIPVRRSLPEADPSDIMHVPKPRLV